MIYIRVGKPGEGKSLTASIDIRERLDKGIKVYTNLHLREDRENYFYFPTSDYEIIYDLQDGEIWFDEGQMLLDARNWEKLPVEFKFLLQKGRHEGLDFYILTQNINQVDVLARRLVHEGSLVWRFFSMRRLNFGIFLLFDLDVESVEKQKVSSFFPIDIIFATRSDWEYYDSFALRTHKDPVEKTECTCGLIHRVIHTPTN